MKSVKLMLIALLILTFIGCGEQTPTRPTGAPTEQATATPVPPQSPYWQEWSDPFTPEVTHELETLAGSWWEDQLDQPTRYAWLMDIQGRYLPPEQWNEKEELVGILNFSQELDHTALEQGTAGICRVDFTVWYQPETYYMGPQYGDGACYVYLLVYKDPTMDIQCISAWYAQDTPTQRPENPDAASLDLNDYQYTMLTHQCRALAAAGVTALPGQWTTQELARYLVVRGQDFGRKPEEWPTGKNDFLAGMILSIDFTGENEWYSVLAPSLFESITPEDWQAAMSALEPQDDSWTFQKEKNQVTAVLEGKAEYTFSLCSGFEEWNSRTFCIGTRKL